tara:strand:- start:9373 stop:9573 length:201 start_codon:yes stop_codon:yes gene_type:complete
LLSSAYHFTFFLKHQLLINLKDFSDTSEGLTLYSFSNFSCENTAHEIVQVNRRKKIILMILSKKTI